MAATFAMSKVAQNTKQGVTLAEIKAWVEEAERAGMDPEETTLHTGATGWRGQLRNLEFRDNS